MAEPTDYLDRLSPLLSRRFGFVPSRTQSLYLALSTSRNAFISGYITSGVTLSGWRWGFGMVSCSSAEPSPPS